MGDLNGILCFINFQINGYDSNPSIELVALRPMREIHSLYLFVYRMTHEKPSTVFRGA